MTLLASQAKQLVEHALGGEVHSAVTPWRCLNGAGHWMCNSRAWRWLRGGLEALALTADQSYVDLPADFGSINAIEGGQGFQASIELTTPDQLLEYKSSATANTGYYYCAVLSYDHADITGTSTGSNHVVAASTAAEQKALKAPTPRLEIYPTPTATVTDGLLLYYTRGWREVSNDTETIFVPDWMEELYIRIARCWAKGYEEDDSYNRDAALMAIMQGPDYAACVRRDTQGQMDKGRVRGGAALESRDRVRQHRYYGTISNP